MIDDSVIRPLTSGALAFFFQPSGLSHCPASTEAFLNAHFRTRAGALRGEPGIGFQSCAKRVLSAWLVTVRSSVHRYALLPLSLARAITGPRQVAACGMGARPTWRFQPRHGRLKSKLFESFVDAHQEFERASEGHQH